MIGLIWRNFAALISPIGLRRNPVKAVAAMALESTLPPMSV